MRGLPFGAASGPLPHGARRREVLVEVCVTSVQDAVVAEAGGADRLEVCSGLVEGGITPSLGLVSAVLGSVGRIGVQVLVRPRGGDFLYATTELEVMLEDISALTALARQRQREIGFVLGALRPDGTIDSGATRRLVDACGGATVTFHRAFDFTPDLRGSLDVVADLGIRRVLTSGGRQRALDGAGVLADLVRWARPGLDIMAGGAVRAGNVAELVKRTGVREVHLRAAHEVPSAMVHRPGGLRLGASSLPADYVLSAISAESVSAVCRALSGPGAE